MEEKKVSIKLISWILDGIKMVVFGTAACMAIMDADNYVLILWSVLILAAVVHSIIFAFNANNSKRKIRLAVNLLELLLIVGAFFFFWGNLIFNSIMILWICPLFIRYFLPNIFRSYSKKRNT